MRYCPRKLFPSRIEECSLNCSCNIFILSCVYSDIAGKLCCLINSDVFVNSISLERKVRGSNRNNLLIFSGI